MGADAIDMDGNTYADDLQLVNLDRKMAAHVARVVVVADSSKLDACGMCKVLGPGDYDTLISDSGIGKDMLRQFERKRIHVEVATGIDEVSVLQ
jgi:DeoR/GlpR family transcriptional regulator of sugar metabolism